MQYNFADELDSYMYQTVGHMGIEKLAEAMELPLYRRTTAGYTAQKGKYYEPSDERDEVEDLFQLLKQIKVKINKINSLICHHIFQFK
jgi:diphthine-ammonia ligase